MLTSHGPKISIIKVIIKTIIMIFIKIPPGLMEILFSISVNFFVSSNQNLYFFTNSHLSPFRISSSIVAVLSSEPFQVLIRIVPGFPSKFFVQSSFNICIIMFPRFSSNPKTIFNQTFHDSYQKPRYSLQFSQE